tara:strand:+ start:952 stop:1542 length:591 start_codon:yes stop_codon:yes gene_type:complete
MTFKLPNFGKLLKMKYNFNPVLQNQVVLYLFLFMTLTQVVLFVSNNDTAGIVLMCIIGFLTTFFSKNMIVILCVALTMTNLVKRGMKQVGYEGFEDKEEKKEEKKEEDKEEKNTTKKEKKESIKVDDEVDDAPNSNESSSQTKDEMKREFEKLKEEYPEFSALKEDIVDAMVKIDPILDKAETFMNKYSKYKSQKK